MGGGGGGRGQNVGRAKRQKGRFDRQTDRHKAHRDRQGGAPSLLRYAVSAAFSTNSFPPFFDFWSAWLAAFCFAMLAWNPSISTWGRGTEWGGRGQWVRGGKNEGGGERGGAHDENEGSV
jgi:hypothetical protein